MSKKNKRAAAASETDEPMSMAEIGAAGLCMMGLHGSSESPWPHVTHRVQYQGLLPSFEACQSCARHHEEHGASVSPLPTEDEPTATLYGMWREPGQGYRSATVALPQSLVERYATKVSEPDLLSVTLGRVINEIESEAVKG